MAGVLCSMVGANYAPAVANTAVTFDGTGDSYSATGLTTTATDGKYMTFAFTFYLPSSAASKFMDLVSLRLGTTVGNYGFYSVLQSTRLHTYFPDNSGSNTGQTYGDFEITGTNAWHQIVYYHDATAFANCKYFVDGVDRTSNLLNGPSFGEPAMANQNFNWGATGASVVIGNGISGWNDAASDFDGRLSQLYIHNAAGAPTISNYWDSTSGKPKDLGTNGTATGLAQPLIYHYGTTSTFPTNNGTGFNSYTLTANGGVTGAEGPSYAPPPSRTAVPITANGNARVSTTQSKFGGASFFTNTTSGGTASYLNGLWSNGTVQTITNMPNYTNYTVEFWLYVPSSPGFTNLQDGDTPASVCIGLQNPGDYPFSWSFGVLNNATVRFAYIYNSSYSNYGQITSSNTLASNTWYHLAFVKTGTGIKIYIDGTERASGTLTGTMFIANHGLTMGSYYRARPSIYMDEIRISSTNRYTANFTAPTAAFTNDANTLMLLHCNGANASTTFTDDNA